MSLKHEHQFSLFVGDDSIDASQSARVWVQGGAGRDAIVTAAGPDLIEAGSGRDVAISQGGNDELWAANRSTFDAINNQTDADTTPDREADLLDGGLGEDSVYGWAGADNLFGGSGKDLLVGGAGDDNIFGDRVISVTDVNNWQVQRQVATDAGGTVTSRGLNFININYAMGQQPQGDLVFGGAGNDDIQPNRTAANAAITRRLA